jgi:hypothetical protein
MLTLHLRASAQLKLEPVTGIPLASQTLSLRRTAPETGHGASSSLGQLVDNLDDDSKTLADYGVQEYMTIRVRGGYVPWTFDAVGA